MAGTFPGKVPATFPGDVSLDDMSGPEVYFKGEKIAGRYERRRGIVSDFHFDDRKCFASRTI